MCGSWHRLELGNGFGNLESLVPLEILKCGLGLLCRDWLETYSIAFTFQDLERGAFDYNFLVQVVGLAAAIHVV